MSDKIYFEIVDSEGSTVATLNNIRQASSSSSGEDLNNLASGTCNLQTRVLTSQMAEGLTKENFEDFSPENMNLTNIDSSPMNEFRFDITEERDSNRFRFEIVKPASSNSYCVGEDSRTIEENIQLVMPITTSNDDRLFQELEENVDEALNISYSGNRYSLGNNFFDIDVSLNKDSRENPKSFVVDLKPSEEESLSESFTDDEVTIYVEYEQEDGNIENYQDSVTIRLDENACNSQQSGNEDDNGEENDETEQRR